MNRKIMGLGTILLALALLTGCGSTGKCVSTGPVTAPLAIYIQRGAGAAPHAPAAGPKYVPPPAPKPAPARKPAAPRPYQPPRVYVVHESYGWSNWWMF